MAVDPTVIKLGSKLWIEGIGEVVAATREVIKGNRLILHETI